MALEGRAKKKDIPEGLWLKCPGCKEMVYRKRVEENLHVCPECQYHFKIGARHASPSWRTPTPSRSPLRT